jgi:nucleoside-triphosphatase THEP1
MTDPAYADWVNPWVAVVGRQTTGRTQVLDKLAAGLRQAGLRVGGALQRPACEGDEVVGYDAISPSSGDVVALARKGPEPELCEWRFCEDALDRVREWATAPHAQVIVLELGPLEARGQGNWPAVRAALAAPDRLVILGIRPAVLAPVVLRLPDPEDGLELPAPASEVDSFVERIVLLAAERAPRPVT